MKAGAMAEEASASLPQRDQTTVQALPEEGPLSMKALLEAGVHFGHQTSHWHPRMKSFIFTERNGVHIIDLQQTIELLEQACQFVTDLTAGGQSLLMVGTKKQAQATIEGEARRSGQFYVTHRWLGGALTNFGTIQARIDYLVRLEDRRAKGEFARLPKKEVLKLENLMAKMDRNIGGIKEMTALPGALYIVDIIKERIAVEEARRLGIPVVALVDTNCNPALVDHPIPGNDDAMRSIRLMTSHIAGAALEGVNRRLSLQGEPEGVGQEASFTTAGA